MATNVLVGLRKYCCHVLQCVSKTEAYQADPTTQTEDEIIETQDIYDLPNSQELGSQDIYDLPYGEGFSVEHVANESNIDIGRNMSTLPIKCQTRPKSESHRSQSMKLKCHGVKLPGMIRLKRRQSLVSAAEKSNPNGYYNVNFAKRLIQRFNIHFDKEESRCQADETDRYGTGSADKSPLHDTYDNIVSTECGRDDEHFGTYQNRISDNEKCYPTNLNTQISDIDIYDEVALDRDTENDRITPSALTTEHSGRPSKRTSRIESPQEDWEENPAYNELHSVNINSVADDRDKSIPCESVEYNQNTYINHDHTKWEENTVYEGLDTYDEKQAEINRPEYNNLPDCEMKWEENVAYVSEVPSLTVDEKRPDMDIYDNVFETVWEENPNYDKWSATKITRNTTSVRSDNCIPTASYMRSSINPVSRSRAYTESMLMRRDFQQDLKMAINTRLQKTALT